MVSKLLVLVFVALLSFAGIVFEQSNNKAKKNYTFATSASAGGDTIYISTVFCWTCGSGQPCNGVVYGGNSKLPCDFLESWALSNFKNNQPNFKGKNVTVACVAESLTMYDFTKEDSIKSNRNSVIDNYRNKQHKTVMLVNFPSCKE